MNINHKCTGSVIRELCEGVSMWCRILGFIDDVIVDIELLFCTQLLLWFNH